MRVGCILTHEMVKGRQQKTGNGGQINFAKPTSHSAQHHMRDISMDSSSTCKLHSSTLGAARIDKYSQLADTNLYFYTLTAVFTNTRHNKSTVATVIYVS